MELMWLIQMIDCTQYCGHTKKFVYYNKPMEVCHGTFATKKKISSVRFFHVNP